MNHDGRLCECGKPVRLNTTSGRNKGYYRTCGLQDCTAKGKRSARAAKAYLLSLADRTCKICSNIYTPTSTVQKWCVGCIPTLEARSRYRRYGLTDVKYQEMMLVQNKLCAICKEKFPRCVDHDHKTKKVRKLLCDRCNFGMSFVDDELWLEKAIEYALC